jgi:hypothetical protein
VIDAVILDGFDDKANVLGVKGLGELGICGAGAAVGNAVFNATGVRVRDFPITLDKLLPALYRGKSRVMRTGMRFLLCGRTTYRVKSEQSRQDR